MRPLDFPSTLFDSTGSPMPLAITAEEWIKAVPARVFRALTDLRELDAWLAEGQTLALEGNEREIRKGSRICLTAKLAAPGGGVMKQTFDVSAFERDRSIEVRFTGLAGVANLGPIRLRYDIAAHGAGARLVSSLGMDGTGLIVRLILPLFVPAARRRLKAQLARLKMHIEGHRAA